MYHLGRKKNSEEMEKGAGISFGQKLNMIET